MHRHDLRRMPPTREHRRRQFAGHVMYVDHIRRESLAQDRKSPLGCGIPEVEYTKSARVRRTGEDLNRVAGRAEAFKEQ